MTAFRLIALCLLCFLSAAHAADGSLSFDGVDDYVEVPNFQTLGVTSEVTVEFWALTDVTGQQSAFMLSPDQDPNRFQAHISFLDGNTYWDFGNIGGGGRVSIANPAGSVGNWTHYALVGSQTGNYLKIYVNGAEVAIVSTFNAFETTTAYALHIGGSTGFFLDGKLDDFRIWNVARTQEQIQANLTEPLIGGEAGLRLYFKFDEGSGSTAVNSATATGAAYNGTLVNGPAWSTPARTTYTVTTTTDEDNTPSGANVSLREALRDGAAASGPALVTFAPALSGQTITLNFPDGDGSIEVDDTGGVTIDATSLPGGLTIKRKSGYALSPFYLFSFNNANVTLRGLTLGNVASDPPGGGIINWYGTLSLTHCTLSGHSARAILNFFGTLSLSHCTLSSNSAPSGGGGGAVTNSSGTLTLADCILSGNSASSGGAISIGGGTLSLTHCTLSGNSANGSGGAISNDYSSTLSLTHCTLSSNSGGAIFNNNTLSLNNSIVAGNTPTGVDGADINNYGTLTLVGVNLVQSPYNSGGIVNGSGTISIAAPLLAPLGNYGGPTQTMPLLPGSPARNAAVIQSPAVTSDQRGYPIIGVPDIGAYEAGTFNSYTTWIWETLPTPGNGTLTDPLHASTFDYDSDGQNNGDEWNTLTHPASGASFFLPTATRSGTNLIISFPTVISRTYTLQRSDNLISGSWTTAGLPVPVAGDGSVKTFTVLAGSLTRRFFRVLASP